MNQSTNSVDIIGVVDSVNTRVGLTKDNIDYVSGNVVVDTGQGNKVSVDFFSTAKKKDGTDSSLYAGVNTFLNEVKTIADHGRENATPVEFKGAQLSENFFSVDGTKLIEDFRVSHNFLRKAKNAIDPKDHKSAFTISGVIGNVVDEIDKSDLPTGAVVLSVITVGYNDKVNVLKLKVVDKAGVAYVKTMLKEGDFCKFAGNLEYVEDVEVITEAVGFGQPIEQVKKRTFKQLTVQSITNPEANPWAQDELNAALQTREADRAAALSRAKQNATKASTPAAGKATASSFTL